jgi:hypothetical protein
MRINVTNIKKKTRGQKGIYFRREKQEEGTQTSVTIIV